MATAPSPANQTPVTEEAFERDRAAFASAFWGFTQWSVLGVIVLLVGLLVFVY
jgi:hypothetical protein